MIIDGKDLILGRLASFAAKKLLDGERITIVNAEQVVISGRRDATLDAYGAWLETRNLTNPRKGPFHLKRPEELVRIAVRGMLPFDRPRGREAFRRLRVHIGVPEEFAGKELASVPDAGLELLRTRRFIRIGELSRHLGAGYK
jgi:large subunit ribosomal protein L13